MFEGGANCPGAEDEATKDTEPKETNPFRESRETHMRLVLGKELQNGEDREDRGQNQACSISCLERAESEQY